MKCPECKCENQENAKFCNECGIRLIISCPQCNHLNPPNSQFCNECGKNLHKLETPQELEPPVESERKHVTVMFSDLSGYTAMTEKLDPENVRMIMNRIFEKVSMIITKYDGFIERYIGDSVMAVFGIPRAHEDDPIRAIRTAIEIHESVQSSSQWVEDKIGRKLSMHTGINTGLVVTGKVNREKGTHGLTGLTINIASRLESISDPDDILVSYNTYLQAEREFYFEEMEPVKVKGKSDPLRVYKLIAAKGKTRATPEHVGLHSKLVGRTSEISLLMEKVEELKKGGRGGIVWITGDAGIGKSRLLAEVKNRISDNTLLWLEGRALSYGKVFSYWPFLDILKQYAGITEEDDEIKGWKKLQAKISVLFPDEVADTLPYLATLLAVEVKGNFEDRVRFLDGEAMKRQIFRTSRRFLSRLAQEQPLLLEFEDFHWADQSTVELIDHLLPLVRDVPIVFCFASRPERQKYSANLNEIILNKFQDYCTELNLSPLEQEDSVNMVCNILDLDEITPQIRDIINIKSLGNPLYLEELIRTLISTGMVSKDRTSGKWQINHIKGKVPIPDSLRGLITAGIDRLDEDIKDVLRAAAVIGRSFLYRLLKEIKEAREELDKDLSELEKNDLIREKCRTPELEYIFKHDLVKESVYESILLEQRKSLHRTVAEAIEKIYKDHLEKFYGLLAYHYSQASNWAKAHDYLLKTGDQAGRMAADTEALAHYKKAVAAYENMFGDRWEPLHRAGLERKIGEALFRRGQHKVALETLNRALALIGEPLPSSPFKLRFRILINIFIQIFHRVAHPIFYRESSYQITEDFEEWVRLMELIGWIDYYINNERLLFNIIFSLNISERRNHISGIARSLSALGMILDANRKSWMAKQYHSMALVFAEKSNHPISLALTYFFYGMHLHFHGEKYVAVRMYKKSAEIGNEIGNMKQWAAPTIIRAILLHQEGNLKKSADICQRIVNIGNESSDEQIIGWGLHGLGKNLIFLNEIQKAEKNILEATQLLKNVPDYYVLSFAMSDLALCYNLKGEEEKSLDILNKAIKTIEKHSLRGFCVWSVQYIYAEILIKYIDKNIYKRSKQLYTAKKAYKDIMKISKYFKIGIPKTYRLKANLLWVIKNKKRAIKWWQASIRESQLLGNKFEEGLTYFEMGKRLKDSSYLIKSKKIFIQLGVRYYLSQTQEEIELIS